MRPPPGDGRQRFSHPIVAIGAAAKGTRKAARQLARSIYLPLVEASEIGERAAHEFIASRTRS